MKKWFVCVLAISVTTNAWTQRSLQKLYPVDFSLVQITDDFWRARMDKVATNTLDACILYTETKTGRIRNFERAAQKTGNHEGIYFDDSDVYKAIEAMAYALQNRRNPELEAKADAWISRIAAAQQPDGYINTYYTLTGLDKRWTDMEKHEDYCAGHLIEAGIAYYNATGKRQLLDVGIRMANHIENYFKVPNKPWVSGHQEIELALMKLYHLTKEQRYLQLADWFLDQRGKGHGRGVIWDEWKAPEYCQDSVPVKAQSEITGHAVRAMYLYTGAADVASVTNDSGYTNAINRIWKDVVYHNMYITGGIGSQGTNEGFGADYDLPNETAYCETCASVGMVFWNQRMNILSGEAKYIDVLERSLYNGANAGLALSGDRFFYGNPLASQGTHARSEWFGTACCPSNIARLISALGNYVYATAPGKLYVNLLIGSQLKQAGAQIPLSVSLQTGLPWKGETTLTIDKAPKGLYSIYIRKPGWLTEPVPGNLYHYTNTANNDMVLTLNGKPIAHEMRNGYAVVSRNWKKGDVIGVATPLEVRTIASHPLLKQNNQRTALQYGPLLYCVEEKGNTVNPGKLVLPTHAAFTVQYEPNLLGGTNTIRFTGKTVEIQQGGNEVGTRNVPVQAIPYFLWNNRGANPMQVWLANNFYPLIQ